MSLDGRRLALWSVVLLGAVLAAYSNHFQNSFHFDDFHSITNNPSIRDLRNIPRFFTDARTSTVLPANRSYRPVTCASLALDYRIAGGYTPLYFHLSTFIWFVVLLALAFVLFLRAMNAGDPHPSNAYAALCATALYGLHPVCAETVNYIVQRADLYNTLGAVAGVVLYAWRPQWRKTGLYLAPAVVGALAKPPGLVFPFLLLAWIFLVEDGRNRRSKLMSSLPAFVVFAAVGLLSRAATPPTFNPGAASAYSYRITQPFVAWHYFKSFFLPAGLTADTDRTPLASIFSDEAAIGIAFVCALLYAAFHAARRPETRPIAFGIAWFFLTLLPTSLLPLAEVDNDHRMFFPFAGLTLAVVWAARLFLFAKTDRLTLPSWWRRAVVPAVVLIAVALASGTYARNAVWRTEETLWRDVAIKSPKNGRGLMNYGLALMQRGDYAGALANFERAQLYTPNYSLLEVNLGVVKGELKRDAEAERHFQRAIALAPGETPPYFYYARWLRTRGRADDSMARLATAIALNPSDLDSRNLLMEEYHERRNWESLAALAADTLKVAPGDPNAVRFLNAARAPKPPPTPESLLELSLAHYRAGRYQDCIQSAKEALRLKAGYAEAYNNIAASYNALGQWDEGIRAAEQAVRLKPGFQLARNNLAYARDQKAASARKQSTSAR